VADLQVQSPEFKPTPTPEKEKKKKEGRKRKEKFYSAEMH
jgi:hypothetical protein